MAPVIVVGKLPTASAAVRDEYVQKLLAISEYSRENEPGVKKYGVFIPRDEADTKTAWVVEEYQDHAAYETHMASPIVQEMIKWMGSGKILDGAPEIHMLDYINELGFSKPDVNKAKDPFVVFAVIEWHPGKRRDSIQYWEKVAEDGKSETGTFVYGVLADKAKPDTLYTLEAYESKEYLWEVHVKNSGVQATVQNTKDWRISLHHNMLKIAGGFLSR